MIGRLRGKIDSAGDDWIILDVGGVGYEVSCPSRLLASLRPGEEATLAIETFVREDQIRLFGFANEGERQWFRLLQSVQGVGAKSALAILGTLTVGDLANAIALQDKAMVARAQGVGPKVAGRIVTELRDKAPALTAVGISLPGGSGGGVPEAPQGAVAGDAISALVNLGYAPAQASAAVARAAKAADGEVTTEDLIRLGLKELAK